MKTVEVREFTREFNGPKLFGNLRVVESSHRGLDDMKCCQMATNFYVGKALFEALKPHG